MLYILAFILLILVIESFSGRGDSTNKIQKKDLNMTEEEFIDFVKNQKS